jgi:uncharacterized protein (TIGR03437 family)
VWFSLQGSTLYAQTRAGRVFQTADFETWSPAPGATIPQPPAEAVAVRLPEEGARVVAASDGFTLFALSRNLYRSRDGGRSWDNLTAYISQPVIGAGQNSVAVSPLDADQLAVANDYGVWRTLDGGLTWAGLNESLPNLPVRRILSTPSGAAGARIQVQDWPDALALPPGGPMWEPAPAAELETEAALKARYSKALGVAITALAAAGETVYAGSADGRIWFSTNGGRTFQSSLQPPGATGPVERMYVDAAQPNAALAALSGDGVHVLRTFNGGGFWDAIDNDLPDVPAYSVTADPDAGAVYVATSRGVFWTATDLLAAASDLHWTDVSGGLPAAAVYDARLDPAGVQLYVVVDGYGMYATPAPHRRRSLRIVSAADLGVRPAAPGSLLSVVGARVSAASGGNLNYPVLGKPSDDESQIQVPFGALGPTVSLALDTATGRVTVGLAVQPVSPAIFVGLDGAPMIYDADTDLPLDASNHARSGGRIQIFATGLGKVLPDWPAGLATPLRDAPVVVAPVRAYLDSVPLQVTRAILAPGYIGFYLVEVQLPVIANIGSSQIYLAADGRESNRVQIVIEP